jgi:carbon-monoxide dehydrogenase large subunit
MERIVHDRDGQLLSGSLMDYALPRAGDVPALSLAKLETSATVNLLGAKGVGEAGAIGAPAALLNAAADALSDRGLQTPELPLTSEVLWRTLQKGRQS